MKEMWTIIDKFILSLEWSLYNFAVRYKLVSGKANGNLAVIQKSLAELLITPLRGSQWVRCLVNSASVLLTSNSFITEIV